MYRFGYIEKADMLLHQALEIDPAYPFAIINNAYHLAFSTKQEQALIKENLMNSDNSTLDKQITLGDITLLNHQYAEAKEHYQQAILIDPTNDRVVNALRYINFTQQPLLFSTRFMIHFQHLFWLMAITIACLLLFIGDDAITILYFKGLVIFVLYTWISPTLLSRIADLFGKEY